MSTHSWRYGDELSSARCAAGGAHRSSFATDRNGLLGLDGQAARSYGLEMNFGPVPDGMVILHSCDTPSCANVEHLSLGTQRENVADMFSKGRADRRGDRSNTAHLTWDQVREIRKLASAGASRKELHLRFGICTNQVGNIINNHHWIED